MSDEEIHQRVWNSLFYHLLPVWPSFSLNLFHLKSLPLYSTLSKELLCTSHCASAELKSKKISSGRKPEEIGLARLLAFLKSDLKKSFSKSNWLISYIKTNKRNLFLLVMQELLVSVTCWRENKKTFVAAQCSKVTSSCSIYYYYYHNLLFLTDIFVLNLPISASPRLLVTSCSPVFPAFCTEVSKYNCIKM